MKTFCAPTLKRIQGLKKILMRGVVYLGLFALLTSSAAAAELGPYSLGIQNKVVGNQLRISEFNSLLDVTRRLFVDEQGAGLADDVVGVGTYVNPVVGVCPTGTQHLDVDDDLVVDDGECFTGLNVVSGSLGIGTADPKEKLHVFGAMIVGLHEASPVIAGTIEWDAANFRGYTGTEWVNLDAGADAVDNAAAIATNTTAIGTKTDKVIPAVVGNLAGLDGTGNLVDSGLKLNDAGTLATELWSAEKIAAAITVLTNGAVATNTTGIATNKGMIENLQKLTSGVIQDIAAPTWVTPTNLTADNIIGGMNELDDAIATNASNIELNLAVTQSNAQAIAALDTSSTGITDGLDTRITTNTDNITANDGDITELQSDVANMQSATGIADEATFPTWGGTNTYVTGAATTVVAGINALDIQAKANADAIVAIDISGGIGTYDFATLLSAWDQDASNDYITANFTTDFAAETTTNLSEGTNLYFTDLRATTAVGGALLDTGTGLTDLWSASKIAEVVAAGVGVATLDDVTGEGNTTTNAITVGGLVVNGLTAVADTDGADVTIAAQAGGTHSLNNPNGGDILLTSGAAGATGSGAAGKVIVSGDLQVIGLSQGIATVDASGNITSTGTPLSIANGGTGVATFGGTNTLLFTSAADTIGSITTANNGLLVTSGIGVPSIATALPAGITATTQGEAINNTTVATTAYVTTAIITGTGDVSTNTTAITNLQTATGIVAAATDAGTWVTTNYLTNNSTLKAGIEALDGQVSANATALGNYILTSSILDEDDMISDSATAVASQQSIKAYVTSAIAAAVFDVAADKLSDGGIDGITVTNNAGAIQANVLGGMVIKRKAVDDVDYTVLGDDYIIAYTNLTAARTITLSDAVCVPGRLYSIKDETGLATTHNIIIDPEGLTTVDGAGTFVMGSSYMAIDVYCDGTNWFIK